MRLSGKHSEYIAVMARRGTIALSIRAKSKLRHSAFSLSPFPFPLSPFPFAFSLFPFDLFVTNRSAPHTV